MRIAILLALAAGGCLGTQGDFDPGAPDERPAVTLPEGDARIGAHAVPTCGSYPSPDPEYGAHEGDVARDFTLSGNGPGGVWSLSDFWCRSQGGDASPTVAALAFVSETCSCCLMLATQLEDWQRDFGPRGLVPIGITFEGLDAASEFWDQLDHTHPFVADPMSSLGDYADANQDGFLSEPGFVVIDLATMRVAASQEGMSGQEAELFEDFLR